MPVLRTCKIDRLMMEWPFEIERSEADPGPLRVSSADTKTAFTCDLEDG